MHPIYPIVHNTITSISFILFVPSKMAKNRVLTIFYCTIYYWYALMVFRLSPF